MKNHILLFVITVPLFFLGGCSNSQPEFVPEKENALRAPAYPLITIDSYTSAWSFTDNLNEDIIRHWTGKALPLVGALRVDGKTYRFMGVEDLPLSKVETVLPNASLEKWNASYTEAEPSSHWTEYDFDDTSWNKGRAAFGTPNSKNLSTEWNSKDIWIRRTFDLDKDYSNEKIFLEYSHDDIFELYINGIEVIRTGFTWEDNVMHELPKEVRSSLKPGKNVIAAHCHNQAGGSYVDFGLYKKEEIEKVFTTLAKQKSVQVLPTQTYYVFECGSVELTVIFTAPLLLDDLQLMSTPINYISYQVKSLDGQSHDVHIYMDATSEWAMDTPGQEMEISGTRNVSDGEIAYVKTGTLNQSIFQKKGDNACIDWGYFYLAAGKTSQTELGTGHYHTLKKLFSENGKASTSELSFSDRLSVLAFSKDLGEISSSENGFIMIAYDDLYSIQYFKENRMAYWKQDGKISMLQALNEANQNYASIMKRCREFDSQLMNDAEKIGNKQYAELCAIAYRQTIAAHKLLTDGEGNLLFLSKENFSNGSVATVDVAYPSAPLFLLYNPELLKGMLNPIFYYTESGKWKNPFAAHDIGIYPLANGQAYAGDMPVEESGNVLLLTTAIVLREGNAAYAQKHWNTLTSWVNYLVREGFDPLNQLYTDDFTGPTSHNSNLSIKAILAIAGYGKMAELLGQDEVSKKYTTVAKEMARRWVLMANADDHYRLAFDQPNSWSQKYNLVWDKILGLGIFPPEIAEKETAYYLSKQNTYGLPLDSRNTYTKSDWILWTACLTDEANMFEQLLAPVYKYTNETTTRIPLSDWYETTDAKSVGFRARSVVGSYFMKLLEKKMKIHSPAQTPRLSDMQPILQKSELFTILPDYCPTPDGMAIAPNGDLVLACPNFADISKPACLVRITKDRKISKWCNVPILSETGWAAPMGIAFNEDGDLFVCDNQGWSGAEKAKNKGRILRLKFRDEKLVETIVVASGMEHPNGIRIRNGKLYVTQSCLSEIKLPSGLLVSGVYCFDVNDRDIHVSNTLEDKNLIATVVTKNKDVQYGLDGIVFDKAGNLYVGNFGDGSIHRIKLDTSGKVIENKVWAEDPTQLSSTDGMCIDDEGNIWVADFSENAVARVDRHGNIKRIAQSRDCDGGEGGLDQPGEPIIWDGKIIISCFDLVTGPDKMNTGHDKPFTLAMLPLE